MSKFEKKYKKLLRSCLNKGIKCENRTGIDTYKLFNKSLSININKGFPIVTGKKIFFKKALAEFKWIYEGRTDLNYLHKHNIYWWDDFAKNNDLGKVYGYQIRKFNGVVDQIEYVKKELLNNSRRAVITLWNPSELHEQALPCCYTQLNFVRINYSLNLSISFRSSDLFLGLPYDIIFGALFLQTIADELKLWPHQLALNLADAHIYKNHKDQVLKYLDQPTHKLPKLTGDYNNYSLKNYKSGDYIKAKLVV